jgi:LDH2 family malate/lactate/ureidoglycolate dehydrogenase
MTATVNLMPEQLMRFASAILCAQGVAAQDATIVADSLVQADMWGHQSHGVLRLPWYVARIRSGAMTSLGRPATVVDSGSVVVLDGLDGIGQVLAVNAADLGVERALEHGVSLVGMRNSNHFGCAAYFTRRSASRGCVALLATNASPAMAPWGGTQKSIGANPWSLAAPAGKHGQVVLDIANTAVARGKIYLARQRGESIPEGWATDAKGVCTTDPQQAIEGILMPMAGHKGYVMSFMFDVLAGVLTGSTFGQAVVGPYDPYRRSGVGHLLLTISVEAVMPLNEFIERMEHLAEEVKSSPTKPGVEEILLPGEREDRCARLSLERGIDLPKRTFEALQRLGEEEGIPFVASVDQ